VAKQAAVAKMAESNLDFENFVSIGLSGVMSNLPMGPIVGLEPEPTQLTTSPHEPDVAATPKKYKTTPMLDKYKGEELRGVTYVPDANLEQYAVTVKDGLLYRADGTRLDTTGVSSTTDLVNAEIYVMDEYGNKYVSRGKVNVFHHSSFFRGRPAAAAGEIVAKDGVVVRVTRVSGHYAPWISYLEQFVAELRANGVNLDHVQIDTNIPQ
jgi:hypothetical protein